MSDSVQQPTFGFIKIVELDGVGAVGGYLTLNSLGRPLEFHCTEPVQPNRAQQILFGPTLAPYLYGEQIGLALVKKSGGTPELILSDCEPVLALRALVDWPIALIVEDDAAISDLNFIQFQLGHHRVAIQKSFASDQAKAERAITEHTVDWDLVEPFSRIDHALQELQKAA